MSTTALLLVTAAALLHAAWNALTKRAADSFVFLWSSMALAAVLFLPAALWLGVGPALGGPATRLVLGTSVVHAIYFFTLATAYRKGDFALVYPVARGLGVALAPALATVVFRESLSPLGLSGIALVVLGIVASGLAALGARTTRAGIGQGAGWAIVTGLLIATYSLIDAAGARAMHPIPYIVAMSVGAVTLLSPYVLLRRRAALAHEWRKNGRTIVLAATMNLTGYVLVLFAYRIAKTGYVIAAREISIVLSAFVGSVVFREGALGSRLVGAGLILAGVACVAFAR